MALRSLDRFGEADEAIERGRRADERLGQVSYLPVYGYERATGLFLAGRWDEALVEAEAAHALAEEVGLGMLRSWPAWLRSLIAIHRGDLSAAARYLGARRGLEAREGRAASGWSPRLALAACLLREARGDAAGAFGALRRAWDLNEGRGYLAAREILGPDLARLALRCGDRQRAATVVAGLEALARVAPVPSVEGAALRCRGLLDADVDTLVRSVEAYGRSPRAFDRAQACGDAAAALARAGRELEAAAMFDRALETYAEVGARREGARALATARELGVGRRRRGARKRPSHGWASLTPSELEVVGLAAEGLTNPEIGRRLFVSRRTVQTHLSHAFGKLEIASRVELAAYVARRG
jgi:DNA-binding CsgD family transcriptional regulator/tetratricopeptide (TPR) repeat protein